ncbi:MAG TPA: HAMP domain-containing sensor histidine kinase [Candidatus Limnocylindrales bacterium]|nr:HAMP domain-containing sensor histidine kinase [Candidatus Limnocylindrales bacterium]
MFQRARRRLTVLYVVLFALVFAVFSVVFYVAFRTVLGPAFDIAPDLSSSQAAGLAYQVALERVGIALIVANLLTIGLVAVAAWVLANRTLRPIRDAHARQRRFVADASHEMRTPLAAIRATAESSLEPAVRVDDLRADMVRIIEAAERLTKITNDLLILASADDRLIEPAKEPFDLSVAVAEAISTFRVAHPGTDQIRVNLVPDLRVRGEPEGCDRIVTNLLDNAVRYGGPAAAVQVTMSATDHEGVVEVADHGPGIDSQDLDRIFEPFYRVRADTGGPSGNGLGLAIARSLAERSGGHLSVTSQAGSGATFRLALPRVS